MPPFHLLCLRCRTLMKVLLLQFALLSVSCHSLAQTASAPLEETRLRSFLQAKPVYSRQVFDTSDFPSCRWEPEQAVRDYLGLFHVQVSYYDSRRRRVTRAIQPGPYAAFIETVSEKGVIVLRKAVLYRTAEAIDGKMSYDNTNLSDLARLTGIPLSAVDRQADLIQTTIQNRTMELLATDERVARLLAGLKIGLPQNLPLRKNTDAFSAERQWWVSLKREVAKQPSLRPTLFGPDHVAGPPAVTIQSGSLSQAGMNPDAAEKIDLALRKWANDTDQAFAVCIVRHGIIVLHQAYGQRDGKPMTVNTKSWMASITKPMSATCMMMLADRGFVNLDDPIEKFLPGLRSVSRTKPITLRHLYTHTSGLDKWPLWSDELPDVEDRLADYYSAVETGKEWTYNGQGYTIGGKIIEWISGEAMPLFYLRHLHGSLNNQDTDVVASHADAYSVPLDIARFGQMLLNRGAYGSLRFIRPEIFDSMLPQKLTITLGPNAKKSFGIGLDGSAESFGHGAASAATFHIDRSRDLVVVMTRNAIGTNYDKYNGLFWQAINDGIAK